VRLILRAHGKSEELIQFVADRPGHDRRYAMDSSRIARELKWQPRRALDARLVETVTWYASNPKWVAAVRARPSYQDWLQENYARRGMPLADQETGPTHG